MLRPAIRNLVLQLSNRPRPLFIIKFGDHLNINTVYSRNSFFVAMILISVMMLIILVSIAAPSAMSGGYMMPPLLLMIIVCSIIGSYFAVKSLKEKTTYQKIIGMIVNLGFFLLLISLIVANGIDIYHLFNK